MRQFVVAVVSNLGGGEGGGDGGGLGGGDGGGLGGGGDGGGLGGGLGGGDAKSKTWFAFTCPGVFHVGPVQKKPLSENV